MKKGFIGGFAGAFVAVILAVVVLLALAYIFAPNFLPNSPCLFDSHCNPQKLCCTWRCDSTELKWWKCPDALCSALGSEDTAPTCGCRDLRCKAVVAEETE